MSKKSSPSSLPAFSWEDFYSLADEWNATRSTSPTLTEARLRCIISRAYYGVWNLCREHAEAMKSTRSITKSGNSHDDIIQWFYAAGTPTHTEIASNLNRLRASRVKADYHSSLLTKGTPESLAENALFHANRVLNDLGSLSANNL